MTVCTCFPASAYEFGIFEYEIINDNQAKIVGCKDFNGGHISIPSSLTHDGKEYPIVEIGDNAFSNKNISTVDIPEGITTIDDAAFSNNYLRDVVLPQSLTSLSHNAFWGNDLTSVNLPPNVNLQPNTWGGRNDFFEEAGGEDETIEKVIIEYSDVPLESNIAVKCGSLILKRQWNGVCMGIIDTLYVEGDNLRVNAEILANLTMNTEILDDGVFPKTITFKGGNMELAGSMVDAAYMRNYATGRYLVMQGSARVKEININCENLKFGNRAFSNFSSLDNLNISVSGTIETAGGLFYNCRSLKNIELPSLVEIKAGEFQNCTALESLVIPADCRSINNSALLSCNALKEITINPGDNPIIAGVGTFKQIPVETLTLGRNVISGDKPFYGLKSLKKLVLTSEITELEDYAFAGCTELTEIWCESSTPPIIHNNTFQGVSRDKCRVFVKTNEDEYRETDGWDEFFASIKTTDIDKSDVKVESAGGILTISGFGEATLAIYSIDGTEVAAPRKVSCTYSASHPAGTYIIVVGQNAIKYKHH